MEIRRLDLGQVSVPAWVPGGPRVASLLAYLVRSGDGLILFDTGMATNEEIDAVYRPRLRELAAVLAEAGVGLDEVDVVVNCHLRMDHCGGNPRLPGRPIIVQRAELALARAHGYTLPELVDFAGVRYEPLGAEAEIAPGVWVIPTPGTRRAISAWSPASRMDRSYWPARRTTPRPTSPMPWPESDNVHCGWTGSWSSIPAGSSSPMTPPSGKRADRTAR